LPAERSTAATFTGRSGRSGPVPTVTSFTSTSSPPRTPVPSALGDFTQGTLTGQMKNGVR
jgi:hypothetical protein